MFLGEAMKNNHPKMTYKEFMEFINLPKNQGKTFELMDGYVIAMSSPTTNHQRICGYIARKVGNYLEGKQCEVFQNLNVHLYKKDLGRRKNVFQPDMMVGCDQEKMTDHGYEGTPEWVVEVISKSTARNDYFAKTFFYLNYGVKEYWIVDLSADQITVYLNHEEKPPIIQTYTFNDRIKVSIFDDFYIDFSEVLSLISNR